MIFEGGAELFVFVFHDVDDFEPGTGQCRLLIARIPKLRDYRGDFVEDASVRTVAKVLRALVAVVVANRARIAGFKIVLGGQRAERTNRKPRL